MTINIFVIIKVASEHHAQFCDRLRILTKHTRLESGCLVFDSFLPKEYADEIVLVEKWKDLNAITAHMTQPYTLEFIEATRPLMPSIVVRTLTDLSPRKNGQ